MKQRSHHCRQLGWGASHSLLYLGNQNPLLLLCDLRNQPQPCPGAPQLAGGPYHCMGHAPSVRRMQRPGAEQPNAAEQTPPPHKPQPRVTGQGGSSAPWHRSLSSAVSPSPTSASTAPHPQPPSPQGTFAKSACHPQPCPNSPIQTSTSAAQPQDTDPAAGHIISPDTITDSRHPQPSPQHPQGLTQVPPAPLLPTRTFPHQAQTCSPASSR